MTKANWHNHVNWLNTFLIVGIPIIGLVVSIFTPLYWQTAVWAIAYYFATVCQSQRNLRAWLPETDQSASRVLELPRAITGYGLTHHILPLHHFVFGWP